MAKGTKKTKGVARPGQKVTKAVNKAKSSLQTAQDLYDEVESDPQGPSLQSLIKNVKDLAEKNSQQAQRLTKKQIKDLKYKLDRESAMMARKEKLAEAEKEVAAEEALEAEQELKERENQLVVQSKDLVADKKDLVVRKKDKEKKKQKKVEISGFDKLLTDLRELVDRKQASIQTVGGKDVQQMKNALMAVYQAYQKLKSKKNDPTGSKLAAADKHGNIDEILSTLKKQIDLMAVVADRNDKQLKALKERQPKEPKEYDDLYNTRLQKFRKLGLDDKGHSSISRSMMKAASMFGRSLKDRAEKLKPSEIYKSGVSWALSKAGNNPRAINAILKVDKSLRWMGENVKDLGSKTYEWLHKSMGDIFGYLKRKWSSLSSGEGMGALGKLIGLGALFTSLIGPLLSGINEELEKRYGKTYIQDFIKSVWNSAKTWLIDGIKSFFVRDKNDPSTSTQVSKAAQQASNDVLKGKPQAAAIKAGFFSKALDAIRYGSDSNQVLANTLGEYNDKDTSKDKKNFDKIYITNILKTRKNSKTAINVDLAAQLKTSGFDVSGIPTTVDPTFSAPVVQPLKMSVRGRGTVPIPSAPSSTKLPSVSTPAIATSAPVSVSSPAVTVTPTPKIGSPTSSGTPGARSPGPGPGLSNSQVPTSGIGDAFNFLNMGGFSGA